MSNKKTINNRDSRIRGKVLEFASSVEIFDVIDLYNWWFVHAPKSVTPRKNLQGILSRIDFLDNLGYRSKAKGEFTRYSLKDDWHE